jgi:adenine deaminase
VRAIQMATINPAEYFRLYDRGAIAPGYVANLITITDLARLDIDMAFYRGSLVARQGKALFSMPPVAAELTDTVRVKPLTAESLSLRALRIPCHCETRPDRGEESSASGPCSRRNISVERYPVIEIVPGQILTRKALEQVRVVDGLVMPDAERDMLKLVVVERHRASGNVGSGLVKGFGLKRGALASSVAHDSHNIIAVGVDDLDILKAIEEVERLQGGLVVCADGQIIASLPLPIAGLLSPEPLEVVVGLHEKLDKAAAALGSLPPAPFAILSFLALPVIPELRLSDLGLVDVAEFKLV